MGLIRNGQSVRWRLNQLEVQVTEDQDKIDALTEKVGEVQDNLNEAKTTLQGELDTLKQQIDEGTPAEKLDFSGLETGITSLGTGVAEVGDLKPDVPADEGGKEAAPTQEDGTAQENTADPQKAAERARQNL